MARGDGLQLLQRLSDEVRELPPVGPVDPAFERDLEDADPRLRGQARGRIGDAAGAQGVGDRGGQRRELDQLALPQPRVRVDDGLAPSGVLAAFLKTGTGRLQRRGDRFQRRRGVGRVGDGVDLVPPLRFTTATLTYLLPHTLIASHKFLRE